MSWTRGRWYLDGDRYNILTLVPGRRWPVHVAEVDDRHIEADDAMDNARRIAAAVNATADFSVEGLESIVSKGLTLEMALLANFLGKP